MTNIYSTPVDKETAHKPKEKKSIELVRYIDANINRPFADVATDTSSVPTYWDNLRLVIKGDRDEFDVIAVWDDGSSTSPALYLGYWNDGIIE
jgi:hypothetical protein